VTKRAPELTWQDKAILIVIPVVVFLIFIVANYVSSDVSVTEAISRQAKIMEVRDLGTITSILPTVGTATQLFRVKTPDDKHEYSFCYRVVGSDTMNLEIGRKVQFYGQYQWDPQGGTVEAPYKGKSGQWMGWVVYNNHRFMHGDVE